MKVIRNFKYLGHEWNLNDNRQGISKANYEFFPKYKLLLHDIDGWKEIGCVSTKQEGKALAKALYNSVLKFD